MRLKHIILTISLFSSTLTMAELPQDSRRPGGIAVVPLSTDITQVTFQHKPVLISQEGHQRYAVVGIPLSTPLGSIQLNTNKAPIPIEVKSYPYAEQRIKVNNQDYVNPNQSQLDRYAQEAKEQNEVYNSFTSSSWQSLPKFIRPTSGKFTNSFGRKRFLMVKNVHLTQVLIFQPL